MESRPETAQGPKYHLNIEGTLYDWDQPTITTEQIIQLGGWDPSQGALMQDKDGNEVTLQPGQVIELKPGMGFGKHVGFRRGLYAPRIEEELAILRAVFPGIEVVGAEPWIRVPSFIVPPGLAWNRTHTDIAFMPPPAYPGAPPYGLYVPAGIRFGDAVPNNYQEPVGGPPFGGQWGCFSWGPVDWRPTADARRGPNLLNFVRSFAARLREGW